MLLRFFVFLFASIGFLCSSESPALDFNELLQLNKSYSHVDNKGVALDKKLLKVLKKPCGVFIEVGGHDGVTQSNTKLLEEFYGWKGLLVEASPSMIETCRLNRPRSIVENYALVSNDGIKSVIGDFNGSLMSSINGVRLNTSNLLRVPACTITYLLKKHSLTNVDFFSLDVEGYELQVLKGLDFNYCRPKVFLIEIYKKDFKNIVMFLDDKGYTLVSNFSNYNYKDNPGWDGTHNDYLFVLK
jgi:FkbM family methyltransferase